MLLDATAARAEIHYICRWIVVPSEHSYKVLDRVFTCNYTNGCDSNLSMLRITRPHCSNCLLKCE